jgi:hypothetical protein
MTLDLQTAKYTGQFSSTAGASVVISDHEEMVSPYFRGIHVHYGGVHLDLIFLHPLIFP